MKKRPKDFILAVLYLLACSIVLVPCVSASDPCEWGGEFPRAGLKYVVDQAETLPVGVSFNSTSASPINQHFQTWQWDFDDGTTSIVTWEDKTVETIHPRHVFSEYRDHYDVCLRVTTICSRSNEACEKVEAYCTRPQPGFTTDVIRGPAPLTVHFTDTSVHTPGSVTTWTYKKDGAVISTERDFSYTFTTPGSYMISQSVKKSCNPNGGAMIQSIVVEQPVATYTVMNFSFPTTTPTIALVGVYFGNMTLVTTTTTPATTVTTAVAAATTLAGAVTTPKASPTTAPVATTPTTAREPVAAAGPVQGTPVVPGTGTLSVVTEPAGAQVFVDDVLRGASPASVPGLSAGSHTIRLEHEGYRSMSVPVEIHHGKTTDYSTALVPESGGMGMLPLFIGVVIILALVCAGAYLYIKKKKSP